MTNHDINFYIYFAKEIKNFIYFLIEVTNPSKYESLLWTNFNWLQSIQFISISSEYTHFQTLIKMQDIIDDFIETVIFFCQKIWKNCEIKWKLINNFYFIK